MSQAARSLFDFLEHCLTRLAAHHLWLALSAGGHLGHLRNRLSRRWPSPEQVQTLFPVLDRHAAARVAWGIGGIEARNRILAGYLSNDRGGPLLRLVPRPPAAFARLRPPLILGFFHVGAVHSLGAAFEWLPGPALSLRFGLRTPVRPTLTVLTIDGSAQQRAAAFCRAIAHLESGGVVALALDFAPGPGLQVPWFGRSLELARGPFALARLAGVPLLPLAARWHGGAVEIEVGDELAANCLSSPEVREKELAAAAARWFEGYLERHPAEIGLGMLRGLIRSSTTNVVNTAADAC